MTSASLQSNSLLMRRLVLLTGYLLSFPLMCSSSSAYVAAVQTKDLTSPAFAVSLDATGHYRVAVNGTDWVLNGTLPAGSFILPPSSGSDHLGSYHELSARTASDRVVKIRTYKGRALVFFLDTWEKSGGSDHAFPTFASLPLYARRYSFKREAFGHYEFGALGEEGPWVFFTGNHAIVLSPADHYSVSAMRLDKDGSAASELSAGLLALPRGFSHATMLAAGEGVNAAMREWGEALQALGGKHAMDSESETDPVLSTLGYWTDNGAAYHSKFEAKLGYLGTLLAVRDSFAKLGVPLGYMQLDSWYPTIRSAKRLNARADLPSGAYSYGTDNRLFPEGLAGLHRQLKMPLVAHARWVSPASPHRHHDEVDGDEMAGDVVADPKFWSQAATYLKDSGVTTYQQDWLNHNASTDVEVSDPSASLDDMATSMKEKGLTLQYCMAPPSGYMASAQYPNLATIRTSADRFQRAHWDAFLYDSRLATALGARPWTDVFMSSELGNLLIATMSGGAVGVGDALGHTNAENLRYAMRADGRLVKPDVGLRPIDSMYTADAAGSKSPMIALATSGPVRSPDAYYIFAYPRLASDRIARVSLADLGIKGGAVAYNWLQKTVVAIPAGGMVSIPFDGKSSDDVSLLPEKAVNDTWGYVTVVPYADTGIALLGDPRKFAMLGSDGVTRLARQGMPLAAIVDFGEERTPRTLAGYTTHHPQVESKDATVSLSSYDDKTGLFLVTVTRGEAEQATVSIE